MVIEYGYKTPRELTGPTLLLDQGWTRTLALWTSTATNTLGVLCCGHIGLLHAAPGLHSRELRDKIEAIIAEGQRQKHEGHFAEAIATLQRASKLAHQEHEIQLEAKALGSSAGCQIRLFHYRQALGEGNKALELAILIKDHTSAGAAAGNLATVYAQLGDFSNAQLKAQESVSYFRQSSRKEYLAQALYNYGDIEAQQNETEQAKASYIEAISIARTSGLEEAESAAELHLGESYLDAGDYPGARTALSRAKQLFLKTRDADNLASAQADLAELEFDEKKYASALGTLDIAIHSGRLTVSPYLPTHLRGQILLALRRPWEALAEFRKAVNQAGKWRQGALPGDATSIRTVSYLHDVYQDFTVLAASLALKTHNTALSREAVEVLAENRAASLREQIAAALDQKGTLPPEYLQLLTRLQEIQARVTLNPKGGGQAELEQIRLRISEEENRLGIDLLQNFSQKDERNSSRKSLKSIQHGLTNSELLLSFCLGKEKSFLWAITNEQVKLYELPSGSKLAMHAEAFANAVHRGQDAANAGRVLSGELFSQLDSSLSQRPDWLVVGDGALLNGIPFSALPDLSRGGAFLAVNHRLRFLPSESLLGESVSPKTPQPEFVGIADPIYNFADSRRSQAGVFLNTKLSGATVALARLVGSDREVRSAAKLSGLPETQFLLGANATRAKLRNALASHPEIIHFAVHVISPEGKPEEAALALSLAGDGIPELLTPEAISAYRIPNSLVVLSGCSSQQGKALPSAGLIGLSRAWLLAGASAVVVSAWPTPDDSGHFFSSFYSHLETKTLTSASLASRAATALQLAQADMQHSGGYRSSPSFWAAYSIISKE